MTLEGQINAIKWTNKKNVKTSESTMELKAFKHTLE